MPPDLDSVVKQLTASGIIARQAGKLHPAERWLEANGLHDSSKGFGYNIAASVYGTNIREPLKHAMVLRYSMRPFQCSAFTMQRS
jgi:hypothetical protein